MTCTPLGALTPYLNLCKPAAGEALWTAAINGNWDLLDAALQSLAGGPTIANGGYGIRGLNGETTATGWSISAPLIILWNPNTNVITVAKNVVGAGCDLTVSGTNGLDTGSFAANTWYHCYVMVNAAGAPSLSTISSLAAPPTGPAMPAGFTAWAYVGALRSTTGPALIATRMRGARFSYVVAPALVAAGAPAVGVEAAVSLATLIPPNALVALLNTWFQVTGSVVSGFQYLLREVSGLTISTLRGLVQVAGQAGVVASDIELANVGQNMLYLWTIDAGAGSGPSANIFVKGYRVPNGDS